MACIAKYNDENRWYRGRIVCVVNKEYEVLFVDYGYRQIVPISFVKEIEKEFIDLPLQAYKCCLEGSTISDVWSSQDKLCFVETTVGKQFKAIFRRCGSTKAFRYFVSLSENLADGSSRFINDVFKPSRATKGSRELAKSLVHNNVSMKNNVDDDNRLPIRQVNFTASLFRFRAQLHLFVY